jgi:cytochrome c-type biogenesis protein CcmH/NrfG
VSANPFEAETWWNLATALERAGEPAAAAEALDGWLRLSGDSPERERVERDIARLRGRR